MNKRIVLSLIVGAIFGGALHLNAQSMYSWAQRTGGEDGVGIVVTDGHEVNWTWEWSPAGVPLSGNLSISRVGAGNTYVTAESMLESVQMIFPGVTEFTNPYVNGLGGASGMYHFSSEGETEARGINDMDWLAVSTTTFTFEIGNGYSSPYNTLIALFDPGANEEAFGDGFTYVFRAWNGFDEVDVSQWTVRIEDVYNNPPAYTTSIVWDEATGTLSVDNFAAVGDYPDTIVFLDTGNTSFTRLEVVATGLAQDNFAIGIAAAPEPSGALLLLLTGMLGIFRRRR